MFTFLYQPCLILWKVTLSVTTQASLSHVFYYYTMPPTNFFLQLHKRHLPLVFYHYTSATYHWFFITTHAPYHWFSITTHGPPTTGVSITTQAPPTIAYSLRWWSSLHWSCPWAESAGVRHCWTRGKCQCELKTQTNNSHLKVIHSKILLFLYDKEISYK